MTAAVPQGPAWAHRAFAGFKACVYALLVANLLLYSLHGTLAETIDTAAWVTLLLLFELETGGWPIKRWQRGPIHGLRLFASVAVVWAWLAYGAAGEWLDFANASAWLGVVVALELEIRVPARLQRFHHLRRLATGLLYGALAWFALLWFWRSEWLDGWDAMLWLVAFVAIELNIFGLARTARA